MKTEATRKGVVTTWRQGSEATERRLRRSAVLVKVVVDFVGPLVLLRTRIERQKHGGAGSAVRAVPVGMVRLAVIEAQRAAIGGTPRPISDFVARRGEASW